MNNTTPTKVNWTETLTGQALLFSVLAKLLYQAPDKTWLDVLIAEDIFAEAPFASAQPDVVTGLGLLRAWSQAHRGGISSEAFDDLHVDHTRLFVGTGKVLAPPWESVYYTEERLVFQQQTMQVRRWYARFGLETILLNQEPDDHIGLELEFMAHLAKLGLQALETDDTKQFDQICDAQREFLSEHLLRWSPLWCDLVLQYARTDLYRGVAHVTHGSLIGLAAVLGVAVPPPLQVEPVPFDD